MQWSSGNLFQMAAPIYYGAAAAGVLRAAQTIVGVAHIWFLGLDNVVPTEAARRMHSGGPEATSQYLRQVILRWGSITLLFMGIVALFPSLWLRLFFTNKYSGYGHILQLYALFYLLVFFMGPLKAGLQAFEYTVPMFWSYLVMTIFSILFAGPFAKHMGLAGVMAGMILITLLGQGVTGIALLMRMRKLKRELSSTATIGV
jgi:O-antigen/teichoic acid export membrane protein